MRRIGPVTVACCHIDVGRPGQHEPREQDLRLATIADRRNIAGRAGASDGRGVESNIRERTGMPADVEISVRVNGLLVAIAIDVLCHPERDIGNVNDGDQLFLNDPLAPPARERTNIAVQVELVLAGSRGRKT